MKKILVINGHPNKQSLCGQIATSYTDAAKESGFSVKLISLGDLKFDPILHKGYKEIQELEPDLIQAQKDILWAEHVVVVFPMWWGTVPALLKGFLDRAFLPGFAFKYHTKDPYWDRLLQGRTGRIIFTTDAPAFYNWLFLGDPAIRMMKKAVLEFSGIKPVSVTQFDSIKNRKSEAIQKFLQTAKNLGLQGK